MGTILIKKGHVIDPKNKINGRFDILVENGKITRIGKRLNIKAKSIYDASGLIVTPGLIDMHVHLREPGREDKETVETGTKSAAAGGFTTVIAMPNTSPIADNQTGIEYIYKKAAEKGVVNVFATGAITSGQKGQALAEISDMKKSGAIAVTDDGVDVQNSDLMRKAMQYCEMLDIPLISHCEDMAFEKKWAMNEGAMSTKLGLPGKPPEAEELAIARSAILAESTGAQFHFTHVNTERAVKIISDSKKRKAKVTCDTCPHYFTLSEDTLENYDPNFKMNPPLRSKEEVEKMKKMLANGQIDAIVTDHAPHLPIDKMHAFEECENGIVGLETAVGLTLTHLVHEKVIDMKRFVELLSTNPAEILRLKTKGQIAKDFDGDFTIIDLNKKWTVDKSTFKTKGRNTPFDGWEMKGKAVAVVVGGKLIES